MPRVFCIYTVVNDRLKKNDENINEKDYAMVQIRFLFLPIFGLMFQIVSITTSFHFDDLIISILLYDIPFLAGFNFAKKIHTSELRIIFKQPKIRIFGYYPCV